MRRVDAAAPLSFPLGVPSYPSGDIPLLNQVTFHVDKPTAGILFVNGRYEMHGWTGTFNSPAVDIAARLTPVTGMWAGSGNRDEVTTSQGLAGPTQIGVVEFLNTAGNAVKFVLLTANDYTLDARAGYAQVGATTMDASLTALTAGLLLLEADVAGPIGALSVGDQRSGLRAGPRTIAGRTTEAPSREVPGGGLT